MAERLILTHLCCVDYYHNSLDWSISDISGVWLVFFFIMLELSELNANNVDPDQTPRSAVSDLELRCLLMSLL